MPDGPTSRNIPLPVKREVRQRCGFGCVVCGLPLYEYDHLLGWATVKRHVADEITLLCDRHHKERTNRLLPDSVVRDANEAPFNLQAGRSTPYTFHFSGDECLTSIGGNIFTTTSEGDITSIAPLVVDGMPLIAFTLLDGHLLLTLQIFDEYNNAVVLIRENQLIHSVNPWDIELVGTNLLVREASRKFLLDIKFDPPNRVHVNRGRFLRNGVEDCVVRHCACGLVLGQYRADAGGLHYMPEVPRYGVDKNRASARAWMRERDKRGRVTPDGSANS